MKKKIEKILQKWKNSRQEADITEVEKVLDEFFPDDWEYTGQRGSHGLVVKSSLFKGIGGFNRDLGCLIIPTIQGRRVNHFYLKDILKAIELIKENENGN